MIGRIRRFARRTTIAVITALLAGCTTAPTAPPEAINVANGSGISVVVSVNGSVVGSVAPGFRGPFTSEGAEIFPRTVVLSTAAGTVLASWDASSGGADDFDMGPECGSIWLWFGDPEQTFDPGPSIATDCPK
ncbi:MAG TPA: hypothetical protein VGM49_06685 [Candidatus Limnocylindrales bacterium]|jgi:hypothetical protein